MKYRRNAPFDQVAMCHMLYDCFVGVKVSVNLLRHLYLAQYQEQDAKMMGIAERMGHSLKTQHLYIYQPEKMNLKECDTQESIEKHNDA